MTNQSITDCLYRIKENIKVVESGQTDQPILDEIESDFYDLMELIKLFLISERDTAVLPAQRGLLGCRLGRCFCLRQRCPPDTRTPSETSPISRAYALKWQRLLLVCMQKPLIMLMISLAPSSSPSRHRP